MNTSLLAGGNIGVDAEVGNNLWDAGVSDGCLLKPFFFLDVPLFPSFKPTRFTIREELLHDKLLRNQRAIYMQNRQLPMTLTKPGFSGNTLSN